MSTNTPRTKWSHFEKWLKPEHLPRGRGILTLSQIDEEVLYDGHGKSEQIPVARFKECRYALALSNTNRHKLQELYGDDIEACIGKRIVVEVQTVKVGPQSKQVVRIAGAAPAQKVDTKTGEITEGEKEHAK